MKISIKEIALFCDSEAKIDGEIYRISTDSRDVDENTLFIALVGERFDGNDFVEDVLSKGVKAVVCSRYTGEDERVILVKDTGEALLKIANGYRKKFNIPFIALTGSVGKTTSKGMIYSVVSRKFNTLRTAGNLNNEIGVPKTLFCLEEKHQAAVIEMGMNHFDEISRLSKTVLPDIGVITNVGTAHIENLGSREGILQAKCEILHGMKKGSPLIINGDNDMLKTVKNEDYKIIKFGLEKDNDIYAENIIADQKGSFFDVVYDNKKARCFVPSVGVHNVYNALCAICVGVQLGCTLEEAIMGVATFEPEGMRQRVIQVYGMTFIEDCYNAKHDSMCAALESLKTLKEERLIAVLGDMLELGDYSKKAHALVGEKAAEVGCDIVFTFGNESKIIAENAAKGGVKAIAYTDKEELTNYLRSILREGDTVLFKGSRGMKMEEIFITLYKEWEV